MWIIPEASILEDPDLTKLPEDSAPFNGGEGGMRTNEDGQDSCLIWIIFFSVSIVDNIV